MKEYVRLGGRWSIGTDSHIGLESVGRVQNDRLQAATDHEPEEHLRGQCSFLHDQRVANILVKRRWD
ncbi:MAG: hypothetical protein WDO15_13100 [Bacteroidota bacterium]